MKNEEQKIMKQSKKFHSKNLSKITFSNLNLYSNQLEPMSSRFYSKVNSRYKYIDIKNNKKFFKLAFFIFFILILVKNSNMMKIKRSFNLLTII